MVFLGRHAPVPTGRPPVDAARRACVSIGAVVLRWVRAREAALPRSIGRLGSSAMNTAHRRRIVLGTRPSPPARRHAARCTPVLDDLAGLLADPPAHASVSAGPAHRRVPPRAARGPRWRRGGDVA